MAVDDSVIRRISAESSPDNTLILPSLSADHAEAVSGRNAVFQRTRKQRQSVGYERQGGAYLFPPSISDLRDYDVMMKIAFQTPRHGVLASRSLQRKSTFCL